MSHEFLSDEWIAAAREIRARYEDQVPEIQAEIRINLVVNEVPFGDGELRAYIDTTSKRLEMELGELPEADASITADWATAKALFVVQDQQETIQAVMQSFMSGKIVIQGDLMQIMALQTSMPTNEFSEQVAAEIDAITA